jgi:hypothetical protein
VGARWPLRCSEHDRGLHHLLIGDGPVPDRLPSLFAGGPSLPGAWCGRGRCPSLKRGTSLLSLTINSTLSHCDAGAWYLGSTKAPSLANGSENA